MKLPFLLLVLFAFSCRTPQERLNRLVKKHPELASVKSIEIKDTIIIPGKSDSVTTKLIFKKVNLKVDSVFILRFDSTGAVVPDSFKIKRKDIDISIFVDSLGIRINTIFTKKVLESQKVTLKNKRSSTKASISDSTISLVTEDGPDTIYRVVHAKCPQVNVTDADKMKYRVQGFVTACILGFMFILFLMTYIKGK
jgi:hypothetical protein